MKIAHINSNSSNSRERAGYLELSGVSTSVERARLTDLIGLRYDPNPKTIYDFLAEGSFAGLLGGGEDLSGHDLYVIDIPDSTMVDSKTNTSSLLEAQLVHAAMLLCSRKVKPEQIVIVSERNLDIAQEIGSFPKDGALHKLINASVGMDDKHPVSALQSLRIVHAPEKASEFEGILKGLVERKTPIDDIIKGGGKGGGGGSGALESRFTDGWSR